MIKNYISIGIACLVLALTGCANGYRDFYTRNPTVNVSELELLKPGEQPVIIESPNFDREIERLLSKNYRIIGSSSFNGKMHSKTQLLEHATNVRSTHVIYGSKFITNQITSTPIFTPNGFGGINATAISGQHMRYDQAAFYFAKWKHKLRFGIIAEELNPELRKTLGTNKGVRIKLVTEDTPAFEANLFKDDVITSIDEKEISQPKDFEKILLAIPSDQKMLKVTILREGKQKDISLQLR